MNVGPVVELLSQRIGLDPESLGPTALPRAITARMQELGIPSPTDYSLRVLEDGSEFQHLISRVAVPETWFFRGGDVFAFLANHVAKRARLEGTGRKFRVLSAPCSTGEEPYSFAIALLEARVSSSTWQIEGIDLSALHLERAAEGRYSEISFRQTTSALRQRYFQFQQGTWSLNANIKGLVHFRQANLLDPLALTSDDSFDLIFCRNLLIYLRKDARKTVLDTLDRILSPKGILCMGHAEPLEFVDARFKRLGEDGYFLYQRTGDSCENQSPRVWSVLANPSLDKPVRYPSTSSQVSPYAQAPVLEPKIIDRMTHARRLADDGKLDEALVTCQTLLAQTGPSADLFSLMGVVQQARQEREDAVRYYQQALYLDPAHQDALTHLMLLCQEQGNRAQVERLRKRLERAAQGGEA
ncbi:MAG: CheR family methyltransferase [Gemmataceae bacterium]